MHTNSSPREILKQYWGYETFREGQIEIIQSVLNGQDTLALLPTGGGKSICFQVPAMCMQGICIVVSPLIALMKDQVHNLTIRNIKAEAIFSGQSFREQQDILEAAVKGQLKFLYISPERLHSEDFRGWLRNMEVGLIAVDEAHCISQWGYDFRPEYLKIAEIRPYFPHIPIIALTASAIPEVVMDMQQKLAFNKIGNVFRKSFVRKNLFYSVREIENKVSKIIEICGKINGTGIVYTRNRRGTKEIALYLKKNGFSADFYHAGLSIEERNRKQQEWIDNKTRIMVCTNAFGMGIDKADVRFVIHFESPDCMEAYYQEAGRAGRDGKKSYCILLTQKNDFERDKTAVNVRYPDTNQLDKVYQILCNYLGIMIGSGAGIYHDFELLSFCKSYNLDVSETFYTIDILQKLDYIKISEWGLPQSTLKIIVSPGELYRLQVKSEEDNLLFLTILRTNGGYFDFFTPIDELKIALILNIPKQKVIDRLKSLHRQEIVDYQPKTSTPQLMLTQARLHKLSPDRTTIDFLKQRALDRLEKMEIFTRSALCRNQFIANYFGESNARECGSCDNCNQKKKSILNSEKFKKYASILEQELLHKNKELNELKALFLSDEFPQFQETLDWLIDNQWVIKDKKGLFEWKGRK
jgi:ATP-dependent DNA helicase RecQ